MTKVYLSELSKEQARELLIQYFVDHFGRDNGKAVPFSEDTAFEDKLCNLAAQSGSLEYQAMCMRKLQEECSVFLGVFLPLDIVEMYEAARERALQRYVRLQEAFRAAQESDRGLDLPIADLYDLYGNQWVLFVSGPNGMGKSTWTKREITVLLQRSYVQGYAFEQSGPVFYLSPLLEKFVMVDSGDWLPNGEVTRDQTIETVPPSMEAYNYALRQRFPVVVCDAGDNLGQRVTMAVNAVKEHNRKLHAELLSGSLLEAWLVRCTLRGRYEHSAKSANIAETFAMIKRHYADSWHIRDMSSQVYHKEYQRLYREQRCMYGQVFGLTCKEMAHDPSELCEQFCKCCSKHCPSQR